MRGENDNTGGGLRPEEEAVSASGRLRAAGGVGAPPGAERSRPWSGALSSKGRSAWTVSVNMAPMIDIVFLLLFFFLVATRFQPREGMLPARLPSDAAVVVTEVPRTPIRIRLAPDASIPEGCRVTIDKLHEEPIAIHALAGELRAIRQQVPGFDESTPVHLAAGDEVAWDHVANAYNAALAAGFEKVLFTGAPQ